MPSAAAKLCHRIHQEDAGCDQLIPDSGWSYCPACGRSTGHIVIDERDFSLQVQENFAATRQITLRNEGASIVRVEVDLRNDIPGVALDSRQPSQFNVHPGIAKPISIGLPAVTGDAVSLGAIHLRIFDAPHPGDDALWNPRAPRELRRRLTATVESPPDIRPVEEALFYSVALAERVLTLKNFGNSPGVVPAIEAPRGFSVSDPGHGKRLEPGERCTVTVRKTGASAPGALKLHVHSETRSHEVELKDQSPGDSRPVVFAVVGMDFGTTFSTAAIRHCRYHATLPDDVKFVLPPSEADARFPSLVWIDRSTRQMEFGTRAREVFQDDPNRGFLFREIKTLLRTKSGSTGHEPPKIDPMRDQAAGVQFMRQEFGENWGEYLVSRYLQWVYRTAICPELEAHYGSAEHAIYYVFSVPVLDYSESGSGEQYTRQTEAMRRCIQNAGIPASNGAQPTFELAFEPACAALGLLHPPTNVPVDGWPVLGRKPYPVLEGDTLAVFDSGGGTTDVVWATVIRRSDNGVTGEPRYDLRIDHCLGVGSRVETFGGEKVTDLIRKALVSNATLVDEASKQRLSDPNDDESERVPPALPRGVSSDVWANSTDFRALLCEQIGTQIVDEKINLDKARSAAEHIKFVLSSDKDYDSATDPDFREITDNLGTRLPASYIRKILLPYLLAQPLESLKNAIETRIVGAQQRHSTRYYLFVGGNTRIRLLCQYLQLLMGDEHPDFSNRLLPLPEEYRQLQIAYGAAWLPDAHVRDSLSYDLEVTVDDALLLRIPRDQSVAAQVAARPFRLGASGVEVRITLTGDRKLCVASYSVPNTSGAPLFATFQAEVKDNRVLVRYSPDGALAPGANTQYRPLLDYPL